MVRNVHSTKNFRATLYSSGLNSSTPRMYLSTTCLLIQLDVPSKPSPSPMTVGTSILFHSPRVGARAMRIAARRGRDSNEAREPGTSPATVYELTERERVRSSGTRSSQWPSSASGALMTSPRYSTTTEDGQTEPPCHKLHHRCDFDRGNDFFIDV